MTIRWEDLDEEAQELLKPRSVSLTGGTAFHFRTSFPGAYRPENIPLVATGIQFRAGKSAVGIPAVDGIWKMPDAMPPYLKGQHPVSLWLGRGATC